jgi:hypothetical protein
MEGEYVSSWEIFLRYLGKEKGRKKESQNVGRYIGNKISDLRRGPRKSKEKRNEHTDEEILESEDENIEQQEETGDTDVEVLRGAETEEYENIKTEGEKTETEDEKAETEDEKDKTEDEQKWLHI